MPCQGQKSPLSKLNLPGPIAVSNSLTAIAVIYLL